MSEPLDDLYLEWLYSQVVERTIPRSLSRRYWDLFRQLYKTEFVWFVPNDDNRLEDGRDLRYEFRDDCGFEDIDAEWLHLNCSILELLVALSRRLEFEGDGRAQEWFWELIHNIGFEPFTDALWNDHISELVDRACKTLIWRTYNRDGSGGGLFPLRHAREDQRDIELWYQLSAYILDKY